MDTRLHDHNSASLVENRAQVAIHQEDEQGYLDVLRKLRVDLLQKTSECELLKIKLDERNRDTELLGKELDECKLTMFERNEDSKKTHEEVMKSKKLQEDYVQLMTEFLDLGEKTNQYKQNLIDNYQSKTNAINNYEFLMSSGAISHELEECKLDLNKKSSELCLAQAKLRNLEEDTVLKEETIVELRKALDDAKVTHRHEIGVLEEYIQCLKNTVNSYEKTMASYIEQNSEK